MAVTYFRLLWVVFTNPGYVERSAQFFAKEAEERKKKARKSSASGKTPHQDGILQGPGVTGTYTAANGADSRTGSDQRPGLEDFIRRDVFICQGDGRPVFCSHCLNWKPDRTHHCREAARCVRKMDHFCPWVGGVVSETSYKFFAQFVGWGALYCIFNLVVMAFFIAEYNKSTGRLNVHWVITVALAALFGLFTVGMFGSSMQFALINTTTIENLSRKTVTYQIAIHMPYPQERPPPFPTITYSTNQLPPGGQAPPAALKTFAILHSRPGDNPWDLGAFRNFKEVMGEKWYDWILPIKHSPCTNHDRVESQFAVGPVIDRMREEAGIMTAGGQGYEKPRRKHKRRHPRKHQDTPLQEKESARNGNGVTERS